MPLQSKILVAIKKNPKIIFRKKQLPTLDYYLSTFFVNENNFLCGIKGHSKNVFKENVGMAAHKFINNSSNYIIYRISFSNSFISTFLLVVISHFNQMQIYLYLSVLACVLV